MNGFGIKNLDKPAPPNGWTNSSFLVDPWTYNYYHSHWTNGPNNDKISNFKGIHTTDVIHQKALDTIDQAVAAKNQFFMMVAPGKPFAIVVQKRRPLTCCVQLRRIKNSPMVSTLLQCRRSIAANSRISKLHDRRIGTQTSQGRTE